MDSRNAEALQQCTTAKPRAPTIPAGGPKGGTIGAERGNAGGALFKSGSKGGAGNGHIAGILADFLDDARKLEATRRRLFLGAGYL